MDATIKSGEGQSVISGGGSSAPQYWQLVTTAADGTALEESAYYLKPVSGRHLHMPGDVVAYAVEPTEPTQFPVAADYDTTGLFRAKQGGGLLYDSTAGAWYVDPDFQGGGGIDEGELEEYLTTNQYVNQAWLTQNGYLKLGSPLTGYAKPDAYTPITAEDTLLSALGKLEANFGNYVDLTTDQTVGGVKTFTERVLTRKDVVCYAAADDGDLGLPVAGYSTTGIVRIRQGGGIVVDSSGIISVDPDYAGGGGVDFEAGNGLDLSNGILSVKFGTTAGTVCQGNDSRLSDRRANPSALSWSGYSSGSYDGSSAKSIVIPSNTSQLTNGAGFITGITKSMVMNVLGGTKSSNYFLDGSGNFSLVLWSDITNIPLWISGWNTNRFQIHSNGGALFKSTGSIIVPTHSDSLSTNIGVEIYNNQIRGLNNGNSSTYYVGNLYLNYVDSNTNVRIDNAGNLLATGDIVAYGTGNNLSDFVPVATSSTYGLVKYDNSTIGKNSSGQLYVIGGTSGGGGSVSWSDVTGKPSWIGSSKPSYSFSEITGTPSVTVSSSSSTNLSVNVEGASKNVTSLYATYLGGTTKSGLFTSMSYSGSTLNVTIGGTSKSVTINTSSGSSWDTNRFSIKSNGAVLFKSSGSTFTPTHSDSANTSTGVEIYNNQVRGVNNGYSSTRYVANLYFNYRDSSYQGVRVDNTGNITYYGSGTWSDMRLKDRLNDVTNVLSLLGQIEVFRYKMKAWSDSPVMIGVSAQSVLPLFPEVVNMDEEGYYSVDYSKLATVFALQGLKELYARFRPVESRVKVLEMQVRNLQRRLDNAYRELLNLKGKEAA